MSKLLRLSSPDFSREPEPFASLKATDRLKKHICVIGAGPAGLRVTKDLIEMGHTVSCFEKMPKLGGVFLKTYDNMRFVSSSLLSAWSDHSDGQEHSPTYWTADEYISYCEKFAEKYDLLKHVHFCHQIEEIRKCSNTGKWIVTVQEVIPDTKYKRCKALATVKALENALEKSLALLRFSLQFDAIAVCSGANSEPVTPIFKGQHIFKGEIIHSNDYLNPTRFEGKRVLIVGSGESAADIMNEVSQVALKTAIVIRGKHGHIIPRYQGNSNSVTDLNTNRCRYSNSYIFGDTIGYLTQWFKYITSKLNFRKKDISANKIIAKIAELNMSQKTSAFSKYGCKSSGFVEAIVLRDAELFRSDFELNENGVVFKNEAGRVVTVEDGKSFICDTIIACTGYKSAFPFFDKYHPEISHVGMNPRLNYKQIFNIQYPGEIAFIGFVRPAFGSTTAIIELQSRLFSYVMSNKSQLPSIEEQQRVVINDTIEWSSRFKYDINRINSIVDYQIYCDSLAKIMGVMPNLIGIFFRNPYLWSKMMFGPLTTHQYRLVERSEAEGAGCKRSDKRWNSVGVSRMSLYRDPSTVLSGFNWLIATLIATLTPSAFGSDSLQSIQHGVSLSAEEFESIKIIERQPYGDFLETVITSTFLIITKIITLFWRKLAPLEENGGDIRSFPWELRRR